LSADVAHVKDLKAGDVQHADEEVPLLLGLQHLVDADHHPQEHPLIDGLGHGAHRVGYLGDKTVLLHGLSIHHLSITVIIIIIIITTTTIFLLT